jgi:hypothetical protein
MQLCVACVCFVSVLLLGECERIRRWQGCRHTERAKITGSLLPILYTTCCTCQKIRWWQSWRHTGTTQPPTSGVVFIMTTAVFAAVWWPRIACEVGYRSLAVAQ